MKLVSRLWIVGLVNKGHLAHTDGLKLQRNTRDRWWRAMFTNYNSMILETRTTRLDILTAFAATRTGRSSVEQSRAPSKP